MKLIFTVAATALTTLTVSAQTDTSKERTLDEVSVKAVKKPIETAPGKTIVNIQSTGTTAGKNVLDLLRQSPGVMVDMQSNISMTGKEGVLVMVDGRQTYMSGTDLAEYLKGITADEVTLIELITQPSAHYDVSGNAGIINIKTKKLRRHGFNGSATTSYEQNRYHDNTNTLLLNYRKNKTNWYTNLNYNDGKNGFQWMQRARNYDAAGNTLLTLDAIAKPIEQYYRSNYKLGADHTYSNKLTTGFFINGAYHTNTSHLQNTTFTDNPIIATSTTSTRRTTDYTTRNNGAANAYLKYTLNKNEELNINGDYIVNTKTLLQDLTTETVLNGSQLPDQLTLNDHISYVMKVLSLKADHSVTLRSGIKLESRVKHSSTVIDNDARCNSYTGGRWAHDNDRTNHFIYRESITAFYSNASKALGENWNVQMGLRSELANINGLQKANGDYFERRLASFFPTAYISYKPDNNNSLELNYGRRVERPRYYSLNPFNYYTFWNTYERGNPYLLPQYSHNIELKHNYKSVWNTVLQLSYVTDVITSILISDISTQTAYGTSINTASSKIASLTVSYNNQPAKWWDMMISAYGTYAAYAGILNNVATNREGYGYNIYANNQFTVGRWIAELQVNYSGKSTISLLTTQNPNIHTSIGVSRKVLHDSCIVRIGFEDPFKIYQLGWIDEQPGYYHSGSFKMNSRNCTFAVTYNFGKNNDQKKRSYSAPDEAKRM